MSDDEPRGGDHGHGHSHSHGHGHSHDDGHDPLHGHGHAHEQTPSQLGPGQRERSEERLGPEAGRGKLLFLDAPSGIAGDMTIAALLDLGVPFDVVELAVQALGLDGVQLRAVPVVRGAVGATHFSVTWAPGQPERSYAEVRDLLRQARLMPRVLELALKIFERLARAESEVHRIPVEAVQFHEVGAVDAIVDIVGAAACFEYLGARVVCSPLPMGSGSVRCQHGVLPVPAPATVNCLIGVPTYASSLEGELVTPTGAAIVASVAEGFASWPSFRPLRVGWGAGTRELAERPNAVRAVLGEAFARELVGQDLIGHELIGQGATHALVEVTLDDMSGELAGHVLGALLGAGALDAWATPVLMKKGRPGLVLSALAALVDASRVADFMLRETSSIGVRFSQVSRRELERRIVSVETEFGSIPVKVSGEGGPHSKLKPEFDACVRAAQAHGVPVRLVIERAGSEARKLCESSKA